MILKFYAKWRRRRWIISRTNRQHSAWPHGISLQCYSHTLLLNLITKKLCPQGSNFASNIQSLPPTIEVCTLCDKLCLSLQTRPPHSLYRIHCFIYEFCFIFKLRFQTTSPPTLKLCLQRKTLECSWEIYFWHVMWSRPLKLVTIIVNHKYSRVLIVLSSS